MSIEDGSVEKYSTHCYHGNGLFYNGNENITVTSKKCLPWNINPYFNKEFYPTLKDNHCRNPQDYRLKPWCYTDTVGLAWEYCNVKKCKTTSMFCLHIVFIFCISCSLKVDGTVDRSAIACAYDHCRN